MISKENDVMATAQQEEFSGWRSPWSSSASAWLMLLLLFAASAVGWVTRHGPGLTVDSVSYLSAAQTLANSGQLLVPDFDKGGMAALHHFPPGYSMVLALASGLAESPMAAARWLNLLLFLMNTGLLVGLAFRLSGSPGFALAAGAVFALAPDVFWIHSYAMSESLSLLLLLAGLWGLLEFARTQNDAYLTAAAIAAGFNFLCRYAAVAQILAGILFVVLAARGSGRRKMSMGALYAVLSGLLPCLWVLSQGGVGGTDRQWGFYGVYLAQWLSGARTLLRWIVPLYAEPFDGALFVVEAVLGAALLAVLLRAKVSWPLRRWFFGPARWPLRLFILNIVVYEAIVVLAACFLDPGQAFGGRIQVVPFVLVLLSVAAWWPDFRGWVAAWPGVLARRLARALAVLFLAGYLAGATWWLSHANTLYLSYGNDQWRTSPTLAYLKGLQGASPIYTNGYAPVYFHATPRDVFQTPYIADNFRKAANPDYRAKISMMVRNLRQGPGILVHFDAVPALAGQYPSLQDLEQIDGIRLERRLADGAIFVPTSPEAPPAAKDAVR